MKPMETHTLKRAEPRPGSNWGSGLQLRISSVPTGGRSRTPKDFRPQPDRPELLEGSRFQVYVIPL